MRQQVGAAKAGGATGVWGGCEGLLAQDNRVQWAGVGGGRPQSRGTHTGSAVAAWDERQGGSWQGIPEQQGIYEGNSLGSSEAGAEHSE
jgi:hypothetical protein